MALQITRGGLAFLAFAVAACASATPADHDVAVVVLTPTARPDPVPEVREVTYQVQPGDTVWSLARQYRVSPATLIERNQIGDVRRLRVGASLRLPRGQASEGAAKDGPSGTASDARAAPGSPDASAVSDAAEAPDATLGEPQAEPASQTAVAAEAEDAAPPEETTTHVVVRGETLWRIAFNHGVPLAVVAEANGIEDPTRVLAGRRLVIPGPAVFRVAATPPVSAPPPEAPAESGPQVADEVDQLIERGQTSLEYAEFEAALEDANDALDALDPYADEAWGAERVATAAVLKGTAQLALHGEAAALPSFRLALRAAPDLELPVETSPKVHRVFEQAREPGAE